MTRAAEALLSEECGTIAALIDAHARERPTATALIQDEHRLDYAGLNRLMDRVAAALQRDGLSPGDVISICATTSMAYAAAFLGALRAGVTVAPLAPSSTPQGIASMVADCDAKLLFLDEGVAGADRRRAACAGRAGRPRRLRRWTIVRRRGCPGRRHAGAGEGSIPSRPSTSSIRRARPERPRASSSPTPCAGAADARRPRLRRRRGDARSRRRSIRTRPWSASCPTLGNGGTAVLMPKFDAAGFWSCRRSTAPPTPCWCPCSTAG